MKANKRHLKTSFILCGLAVLLGAAVFAGCKKGDGSGKTSVKIEEIKQDPVIHISLPSGKELVMVRVEAGTFTMGANDSRETPHSVALKHDFYIGQTEVTQAQWKAVMGSNPSYYTGYDHPVESVSWDDAQVFCRKLNELYAGKMPAGYRFDLPTEAQWEYAARGGKESRGYRYSGSDRVGSVAWYCESSGTGTHPVATKQANELDLYDMSGNVWEWCRDWYEADCADDPEFLQGNAVDSDRVVRGGGWFDDAVDCCVAYRTCEVPGKRGSEYGFRVALVPDTWAKALHAEAENAAEAARAPVEGL